MMHRFGLGALVAVCVCCGGGDRLTSYDLRADFSATHNPQGPWSYGYREEVSTGLTQLDAYADSDSGVWFWHPGESAYYPYVAAGQRDGTTLGTMERWAVGADQLAMEASADGMPSVVEFTSPTDDVFEVVAEFTGIHSGLSTTDVHVFYNGSPMFDGVIDGYGGDPAFHAVEGSSPAVFYRATLAVSAGSALTFTVGVGTNGTHFNDTTGLAVHLRQMP